MFRSNDDAGRMERTTVWEPWNLLMKDIYQGNAVFFRWRLPCIRAGNYITSDLDVRMMGIDKSTVLTKIPLMQRKNVNRCAPGIYFRPKPLGTQRTLQKIYTSVCANGKRKGSKSLTNHVLRKPQVNKDRKIFGALSFNPTKNKRATRKKGNDHNCKI